MTENEAWDAPLEPDERIIWEGKPSRRVQFEFDGLFEPLLYAIVLALLLNTLTTGPESQQGNAKFGIFFLLSFVVGGPFGDAFKRSRSRYVLTNKRAIIRYCGLLGPKVDSYTITPDTNLQLKEGRRNAVWFAMRQDKWRFKTDADYEIGFERADDPHAVYQLLRSVQRGTA